MSIVESLTAGTDRLSVVEDQNLCRGFLVNFRLSDKPDDVCLESTMSRYDGII